MQAVDQSICVVNQSAHCCKSTITFQLIQTSANMQIFMNSDVKAGLSDFTDAAMEEGKVSKHGFEFVKSLPDKHLDPLRPSNNCFSMFKGHATNTMDCEKDRYTLIRDVNEFQQGIYDKPLPCFGCGVGWFSFLLGFAFPIMWYYATFLYFGNYCQRDPRERAGLAAAAIAAMGLSVGLLILTAILLL